MFTKRKMLLAIGASLILAGSLASCGGAKYSTYSDAFKDGMGLLSPTEMYDKTEVRYGVFVYSDSCSHCVSLEPTVIDFLNNDFADQTYLEKMYFLNLADSLSWSYFKEVPVVKDEDGKVVDNTLDCLKEMATNKVSKVEDTYLFGTPSLYIINNGAFLIDYIGGASIGNFLAVVKNY